MIFVLSLCLSRLCEHLETQKGKRYFFKNIQFILENIEKGEKFLVLFEWMGCAAGIDMEKSILVAGF
ncbi:MAG: hypothetical protein JXR53_13405 [Bacteroidales bacterium]|nr:hypothetical protein [Bacteroidales bacterium]